MRRLAAAVAALLVFALVGAVGGPAPVVAQTDQPNRIVDYETLFGTLEPDGSLKNLRLVDQIRVFGVGNIVISDPTATEDFRNVIGAGDPEVGEGVVEWRIANLSGRQDFISAGVPDVEPGLSMLITYYVNGERVEASDVVGASGSVDITFDVSNTTAVPMEVTYEDGSGKTLTATEPVPIPMVAELQMVLPGGSFSAVDVMGQADVVTAPLGDLIVRKQFVFVPPIGELTQSFTLHVETDDFQIEEIQLAGAPVAPKDRPFLAFAEEELAGGVESATSLYAGTTELSSNLSDLQAGAQELLAGMQQLLDGARELAAGLQEAAAGSGELTTGLGEASSGSSQITGGLDQLSGGLKKILGGLEQLADGLPDAEAGATEIATGLSAIDAALATLKAGLQSAQAGAAALQLGAGQIAAGTQGVKDCLTGAGATVCGGASPSISTIAGGIGAGAGGIGAGAGDIAAGAADLQAGAADLAANIAALAAFCGGDAVCLGTVTALQDGANELAAGAAALAGGAGAIAAGAGEIAVGAGGIQTIAANLAAAMDEIAAGGGAIGGGAALLVAGLGDAIAGIGNSTDRPKQSIRGGVAALQAGALRLSSGLADAVAGLGSAADRNTLIGGTTAAVAGADELTAGSAKLTTGLDEAESGSARLTSGLEEAADGSGRLADGLGQAAGGAGQVEQGTYLINEVGVREISRSASETAGEIGRQLAVMKAQDERAAVEALPYGPPSSDQAESVVGGSALVLTVRGLDEQGRDSVWRVLLIVLGALVLAALYFGVRVARRLVS